ncbi:hypothetical protein AB0L00_16445 [Actinoallomurus sp. NPDC052308]|uniref:hypothetical protein n=1 Tax=Actinoallomurus sp. NPDC052308 TaxID=3155530 RepID=UPI003442A08E
MAEERSREELEEELRVVEDDIASLRPTLKELRRQIGQQEYGPTDPAEQSVQLQNVEEQEAILGRMEDRRVDLLRRLGKE